MNPVLCWPTVNHLLIRTLCGFVTGNCPLQALLREKSGVWWILHYNLIFLSSHPASQPHSHNYQLTTNKTQPGLNSENIDWTVYLQYIDIEILKY